jgi:hypothetical protein
MFSAKVGRSATLTEAFVFGQYRTYQIPVATIARSTFKGLVPADALRRRPLPEAVPGKPPVIPLDRLENMVL